MVANLPVVRANLDKVFQLAGPIVKFTQFDRPYLSKARLYSNKVVKAYIKDDTWITITLNESI